MIFKADNKEWPDTGLLVCNRKVTAHPDALLFLKPKQERGPSDGRTTKIVASLERIYGVEVRSIEPPERHERKRLAPLMNELMALPGVNGVFLLDPSALTIFKSSSVPWESMMHGVAMIYARYNLGIRMDA